ncbi:septal ring lytic transglycosylase RlpA family protein [Confluentibacter flavum]|uniref:Probable endolytic peptidoglycan transglycosylase RlpA n=1 Tax=Confluentibacter flavum TaxID=1909700 RepID=A0A2N3HNX8_9FLAO|nr:septal ring lytic transglycosylase RlpA family protein [Confluentibacter flavum]PKQ46564.1 septal ring lytic transglycosylase RlpA family lipoprotein [Confluentibacter flavum]
MKLLVLFIKTISFVCLLIFLTSFINTPSKISTNNTSHFNTIYIDTVLTDTIAVDSSLTYITYKENVHASYYHDKFNGRKTASGEKFDNNLYTAAHRTLKFGTKIKVTNTVNNQSVIVTVNDRGPFVKDREIDLSKIAFMEITKHKLTGFLIVHLEVLKE